MSNRSISVYAKAMRRNKEEENNPRPSPAKKPDPKNPYESKKQPSKQPSYHGSKQPSNHAAVQPRYHDSVIELLRSSVKEFGKESATHRFTVKEKKALVDIVYAYKGHGVKTNENEITRIAVNFLVSDYNQNGENSILDRTLKALNE